MSPYEIPIFPLNTVLFPGIPLHLHIFEPRYQLMMRKVLDGDRLFGVSMIKTGVEANGPIATPHNVGCIARVTHVEPLPDGRMNLTAIGKSRFRIVSLSDSLPYLCGYVEDFPLGPLDLPTTQQKYLELRMELADYIKLITEINQSSYDPAQLDQPGLDLPDDPTALLFLTCALLQVPAAEKQPILEIAGANEILTYLLRVLKREIIVNRTLRGIDKEEARRSSLLN